MRVMGPPTGVNTHNNILGSVIVVVSRTKAHTATIYNDI